MKTSMHDILHNLEKFSYEAKSSACGECKKDFKGTVSVIADMVRDYFDGLCLDCLDRSKPKLGTVDEDYWQHHRLKEHDWITTCRVRHKQPTWYFSFNGRKEDMDTMYRKSGVHRGHDSSDDDED